MKKMNNKGFSLVELIIVIAIMAILAAALAPQLIKYLEKSRESTDASTCDTIKSAFNAAVTNEKAYDQMMNATKKEINITFSGSTVSYDNDSSGDGGCGEVVSELKESLSQIKAPKATGKKSYKITWTVGAASGSSASALKNVVVTTES